MIWEGEHLRVAGLAVAGLFALYGIHSYRRGGASRFGFLISLLIALGVAVVSVFPQVGEIFTSLFGLENRAFALLSFAVLLIFALILYLIVQVDAVRSRGRDFVEALAVRSYLERYGGLGSGGLPSREDEVLILVPAFNEGGTIGKVVDRIPKTILGRKTSILVLVDGATDDTEAVALASGVAVATLATRLGKGDALHLGFKIATLERAGIVVTIDADGQYLPEEIERVVRPVSEDEADFVIGSRFLGHYQESGSVRHIGVVFFSALISAITRRKITDCTSGLRAMRGSELWKFDLREEQFETNEVLLEAYRNRLRIIEVPATMLKREEGESKKPPKLWYPLGVMWVIVRTWLRGKPVA